MRLGRVYEGYGRLDGDSVYLVEMLLLLSDGFQLPLLVVIEGRHLYRVCHDGKMNGISFAN